MLCLFSHSECARPEESRVSRPGSNAAVEVSGIPLPACSYGCWQGLVKPLTATLWGGQHRPVRVERAAGRPTSQWNRNYILELVINASFSSGMHC